MENGLRLLDGAFGANCLGCADGGLGLSLLPMRHGEGDGKVCEFAAWRVQSQRRYRTAVMRICLLPAIHHGKVSASRLGMLGTVWFICS